jgi:hypothetical protein
MTKLQTAAELIVVARPEADLRVPRGEAPSGAASASISSLTSLLKAANCELKPLFGATEERVSSWVSPSVRAAAPDHPDPALFYTLRGNLKNKEKLIEDLLNEPSVLGAYFKPPGGNGAQGTRNLRTVKFSKGNDRNRETGGDRFQASRGDKSDRRQSFDKKDVRSSRGDQTSRGDKDQYRRQPRGDIKPATSEGGD